jgi:hypothetical protein
MIKVPSNLYEVASVCYSTGHIPVMVSATDFTTVALALANDAVKNATGGDFVKITNTCVYLIICNYRWQVLTATLK